ncbi:MAG TPA: pyridoxal-phosphate dependent enzyme [Mycobacteriales bacterium]|nr:pyridoxal-phosphate dependent enzyme [Mycobacteriales bacterium]
MPRSVPYPTESDFAAAREVVSRYLTPTPLVPSPVRRRGWLKLETFQPTGSFKVRGALAALAAAPADRQVISASAGNHALGMAFAARALDRRVQVIVPETASEAKLEALRTLPVQLVTHGESFDEAEMWAVSRADAPAKDVDFVSPYNDPHVIAGQATILDEIVAQMPIDRPLTVVAGAGGGGLLSGLGLRASQLTSDARPIRVIGVEAEASPAISSAIEAGQTEIIEIDPTLADGLAGNLEEGSITAELIARHVAEVVQVTEDDIAAAIRWLVKHHGVVAEGAGAVPVAALQTGVIDDAYLDGEVVAVISGRNIALDTLADVLKGEDIVYDE